MRSEGALRICVVGLGRVGLTLATTLANVGFRVVGTDKNKEIVAKLNDGVPPFFETGLEPALKRCLDRSLFIPERICTDGFDAYIICVGTPLDKESGKAFLQPLLAATDEVGKVLSDDALVVVRSTVPLGATRSVVLPILQKYQQSVYLACCPERTVEGRALSELRQLPQIIGGLNQESVERAVQLFSRVTATTVRMASLEAAEMTKLIDNTNRDISFAFANEIALLAERFGLDGSEVIRSANLGYPRNNVPVPGFVGGTCLTKDPHILIESAAAVGAEMRLAQVARAINLSLPFKMAERLKELLVSVGKRPEDSRILVAGVAFKGQPDTDDVRDSPAAALVSCLSNGHGQPKIFGHDFVVPPEEIRQINVEPCSLEDGFRGADAVIFANNHPSYQDLDLGHLASLMNNPGIIADAWHIFDPADVRNLDGIIYEGLGVG